MCRGVYTTINTLKAIEYDTIKLDSMILQNLPQKTTYV